MSEEKRLFSFEKVKSSIVAVFFIGAAWTRLEYKMDAMNTDTKNLLEKYVISNDLQKEMLSYRISELKATVENNTTDIISIKEFLKPDEIKPRKYANK